MQSNVVEKTPDLFSGSGDHLVSEAFYLTDPEGNGVELYYDRDRSVWQWEDGLVKMDSLYIPLPEYINTHAMTSGAHDGMQLGHVHLKVGDIQQAKKFYIDIPRFYNYESYAIGIVHVDWRLPSSSWYEHVGKQWCKTPIGFTRFAHVRNSFAGTGKSGRAQRTVKEKQLFLFEEISRGILFKDPRTIAFMPVCRD